MPDEYSIPDQIPRETADVMRAQAKLAWRLRDRLKGLSVGADSVELRTAWVEFATLLRELLKDERITQHARLSLAVDSLDRMLARLQ